MKKALEYIISSIADYPEKVVIEELEQDGIINFTVNVAKEDMGKVIGKNGKIIRAIRSVIKIPAIKRNKRINVTLADSSNS